MKITKLNQFQSILIFVLILFSTICLPSQINQSKNHWSEWNKVFVCWKCLRNNFDVDKIVERNFLTKRKLWGKNQERFSCTKLFWKKLSNKKSICLPFHIFSNHSIGEVCLWYHNHNRSLLFYALNTATTCSFVFKERSIKGLNRKNHVRSLAYFTTHYAI